MTKPQSGNSHHGDQPSAWAVQRGIGDVNGCYDLRPKRCQKCGKKTSFRRPDGTCFLCTWDEKK